MALLGFYEPASLVEDQGEYSSQCGYCKSKARSSVSHGMWAHALTVQDYQGLLDRGWRRSGKFLYKPNLNKTCCPPYTIRLPVSQFTPSKEQRRVLRRMERFLDGGWDGPGKGADQDGRREAEEIYERTAEQRGDLDEPATSSRGAGSLLGQAGGQRPGLQSNGAPSQGNGGANGKQAGEKGREAEGGRKGCRLQQMLVEAIAASLRRCSREDGELAGLAPVPAVSVKPIPAKLKSQVKANAGDGSLLYTSNVAFIVAAALKRRMEQTGDPAEARGLSLSYSATGSPARERLASSASRQVAPGSGGGGGGGGARKQGGPGSAWVAELLASHLIGQGLPDGMSVEAVCGHLNFYGKKDVANMESSCSHSTESEPSSDSSMGAGKAWAVEGGRVSSHKDVQKKARLYFHSPPDQAANPKSDCNLRPRLKARKLELVLERSKFIQEEFELYRKYQSRVHGDAEGSLTRASYESFLVDSPLVPVPPAKDGSTPPCGFGSFHQQYRIDGKLVAVGVVDILPHCLSSKYLFWDPDYAFLSLGKYSALQEIEWVRAAERECPPLAHYYLGYYIHSCPKMKYKAAYEPSELLCPLRFQWAPYALAGRLLDQAPVVALSRPSPALQHSFDRPGKTAGLLTGSVLCENGKGRTDTEVGVISEEVAMPELGIGSRREASWEEQRMLQAMSEQSDASMLEASFPGRGNGAVSEAGEVEEMDKDEESVPEDSASLMQLNSDSGRGGGGNPSSRDDSSHSGQSHGSESTESGGESVEAAHPKGKGWRPTLTPQEEERLDEEMREGIGRIPAVISGNSIPFQDLVALGLLTRHGVASLTKQLRKYYRLVGPHLAGQMGYALS